VALAIITFLILNYGLQFLLFVFYITIIYLLISFFLKERLSFSGKQLTLNNHHRLRNINDTFYEIKAYSAENFFLNRQKSFNSNIATNLSNIELYSILPKYLVESVVLISLIIFLICSECKYQYDNTFSDSINLWNYEINTSNFKYLSGIQ
jgi:hypothetical protein